MSKRLNKRQQRELEELEQLKAQEKLAAQAEASEEDEQDEDDADAGPANPFAAKKKKQSTVATPAREEEDTDDGVPGSTASAKKGNKKKSTAKVDPEADGMDEVDRALAELKLKYGEEEQTARGGSSKETAGNSRQFMAFRNLLSVDPKNLDADAELRRFFGSKVIASTAQTSRNHRAGPPSKLRYTISKPKPQYPPATSLSGLGMREYVDAEIDELYERRGLEMSDWGEKWFTFEHSGAWREIERQFLGAVRSHDPNELMALLQVYPWHVDTLLQMSEVYRLQSDIGAASDYAERALYAFDRCLIPGFSVTTGTSRLDFDRVENRPMFTALHRIISYLGRRGCWVTAFNFAKLLFSLDPYSDPHGAAFWLDFLAIKSNNGSWILEMLELSGESPAAEALTAYPGMAFAKALALRADEDNSKSKEHSRSDAALLDAILTFPQTVVPLADKLGISVPSNARSHALMKIEGGYSESPSNVIHLLSHIYVARSEALWKEADKASWFESTVKSAMFELDSNDAKARRADVLAILQIPRDPIDAEINVPLFICRHVLCSESTSWLGFLPPPITNKAFHAYDPLPPYTATSAYDDNYFGGLSTSSSRGGVRGRAVLETRLGAFMTMVMEAVDADPSGWRERVVGAWRDLTGQREFAQMPAEQREGILEHVLQFANGLAEGGGGGAGNRGGMPGAFPGQAGADEDPDEVI
ncbi:transcriptional repressor TCF25-domain-containing protein [Naematelia encephala]|uniref:Transcriptional repressor TCF25-domain-containing protein n=1 Tax=Naematelia encephala TaxID=71784 RepID=A0A1Y2AEP3_9TREE|nr:transcriptional repressor TCF25-domain-containing protein [Naematelia encephala]